MADKFYVIKVSGDLGPYDIDQREILAKFPENTVFSVTEFKNVRSIPQNSAMHKYFELLAMNLNSAGLDMRKVLRQDMDIPWYKSSVKEYIWRPVQKIVTEKTSTAELTTSEPSEIYSIVSRHISQKFGVNVDWPSNK